MACSKQIPKAAEATGHDWDVTTGRCLNCGWCPPLRVEQFAERFVELCNPDGHEPHGPSVWLLSRRMDSVEPPKDLHRRLVLDLAAVLAAFERES